MSDQKTDERLQWALAAPKRKLVQIIEPAPDGWSVTTQRVEGANEDVDAAIKVLEKNVVRQDCEIAIRGGVRSSGGATGFLKRLFGGK